MLEPRKRQYCYALSKGLEFAPLLQVRYPLLYFQSKVVPAELAHVEFSIREASILFKTIKHLCNEFAILGDG